MDSKKKYADKLDLVNGIDVCEIPRNEWLNNIDLYARPCLHVPDCLQAPTLKKACSTTRVGTTTRTLCEDG